MEFLISLTSDRCCPQCQRLVGWLRRTQWTFYHYYDFRQAKWPQMDQIACWSGVCASSQPAESPRWVPQGIVFGFHSQMLHTRHQRVTPHISFPLLTHPCHSWIPLSQLASLSSPHVPVFNPRMSTLHDSMLLGNCSQNMAHRHSPTEFPGVPLRADSLALLQTVCISSSGGGISKSGLLPINPDDFLRTWKLEKHCPRSTVFCGNHVGLDADDSNALPPSSMNLNKTLSFSVPQLPRLPLPPS